MKSIKLLLTLMIIIISISNIRAQINETIIGKWNPVGTDAIITFYTSGKIEGVGISGNYLYDGERLVLDLKREYKYRTITTTNAYIDNDKLYFAYPSKGYLIGSKFNDGLKGEWEAYRQFKIINSKTAYVYENRFEYIKLMFWENYLTITQGYDTYDPRNNSYSYKIEYDDVVNHYYFYRISHPEDRTYYEIIELKDKKLLLLSHKYLIEDGKTTSVTFNYPYYIRLK